MGLTGQLQQKATLLRMGDIADPPNTQEKKKKNHTYKETAKMESQRNMSQRKEKETSPEKELNEMEASNLPDTVFKK